MRHELQGADAVGDAFEIVALSVGKVIHRIGIPLRSCAMMRGMDDAIHDRIAEMHIGVGHIEFGTEHHRAFHGFGGIHLVEEFQVLLDGTVAIGRRRSGCCRRTLLLCDFFRGLLVDIGIALFDHPYGKVPQLLEVVAGIIDIPPVEAEPLDIVENILHVFVVFLRRVGIVETEVAHATVFLGDAEVHADGFGVSDVQVSVGFRWEPGLYASAVLSLGEILFYELFYEAEAFLLLIGIFLIDGHNCILS